MVFMEEILKQKQAQGRRRGAASWLDQKSRQELRTDRANRHRDRNVALISGGVTLFAVFLSAAINKAYHLY